MLGNLFWTKTIVNFWIGFACLSENVSEPHSASCTALYVAWPALLPQLLPPPQAPQPGSWMRRVLLIQDKPLPEQVNRALRNFPYLQCKVNERGNYLDEVCGHQGSTPCPASLAVHIHRAFARLRLVQDPGDTLAHLLVAGCLAVNSGQVEERHLQSSHYMGTIWNDLASV